MKANQKIIPTITSFFTTKYFLFLLTIVLVTLSLFLWKTQESKILSQIYSHTKTKAQFYSSETENRYNHISGIINKFAKRETLLYASDPLRWEEDTAFNINAYEGIKRIAWVDKTFIIRRVAPMQDKQLLLNKIASQFDLDPLDINLWVPSYNGDELQGYVVAVINIAESFSPVISDIDNDYMLKISREGKDIFNSENWKLPREDFTVNRPITIPDIAVLNLSFAPTEEYLHHETRQSTQTLVYSLLLSLMVLAAAYYAQKYNEAAKSSELRFKKSLESMVEGCQIVSHDWHYLFVNDVAAGQNQHRKEEMIGHTMMEVFPGIEKTILFQLLQLCMKKRIPQEMLDSFRSSDGSTGWYELSIQPAPDGILILSNDVTKRKRAEEEVRTLNTELEQRVIKRTSQLEAANRELEAFSYSVSHDLQAPLRAISGFSNILIEEYAKILPKDVQRYLNLIENNSNKMGRLINDLLLFSRTGKQDLTIQKVNCVQLVEQVVADLKKDWEDREIEVVVGKMPSCQADPALIKQVFINLLANAFKFTKRNKNARIEVGSKIINGERIYFVKDNGAGFDMRYVNKLFGVFQRLHSEAEFEGTGVGLAIVQRIIQRHDGRIWVEAEVDKGAVFYFTVGVKNE